MNILDTLLARLPKAQEPRTLDFSQPTWGHNTELTTKDRGQTMRGAMWSRLNPREGDYVILPTGNPEKPTTRYQITEAKWTGNVDDMYWVTLRFAPRRAATA